MSIRYDIGIGVKDFTQDLSNQAKFYYGVDRAFEGWRMLSISIASDVQEALHLGDLDLAWLYIEHLITGLSNVASYYTVLTDEDERVLRDYIVILQLVWYVFRVCYDYRLHDWIYRYMNTIKKTLIDIGKRLGE